MSNIQIHIKEEFSDSLGARYKKDGQYSGEEFYEKLLRPRFDEAVSKGVYLEIYLDGVWGYPSSFVSGSFGKLSLEKSSEKVLSTIKFICTGETKKQRIIDEIKKPTKK